MLRPFLIGLVSFFLVVSIVGAGGPVLAIDSPAQSALDPAALGDSGTPAHQYQFEEGEEATDFDSESFEVTVYENGDATWTFQYEKRLESDEEVAAFEEFAEEFEAGETELADRFETQANLLTDRGSDRTDREMEATDFERETNVEPQLNHHVGYVEMSFTWTEFATVDDGTVTVGDVFEDGLYLGPGQTFIFEAGDGLVFEDVQPDGQYTTSSLEAASSVRWSGERNFHDGQPRAVLEPDGAANAPEAGATTNDGESVPWFVVAGAILAVVAIGGAFAWYRSSAEDGPDGEPVATTIAPSDGDEPEPEPMPDEKLMTDEDRVVSLIRENGGRMKQVRIVEETGWSKSKVSMLLSDMEEEGTISKLRVGRENIISLDGHEPEATKSPFEE